MRHGREKPAGLSESRRGQVRVLLAKIGLDGHDRGIKIVARALRDAGVEVIYLGLHNSPEEIASASIQEDVQAVGLSIHSAAHLSLFEDVLRLLREGKATDIVVFGGGIIPDEDVKRLRSMGVRALFGPGSSLEEVVAFVKGGFAAGAGTHRKARAGSL